MNKKTIPFILLFFASFPFAQSINDYFYEDFKDYDYLQIKSPNSTAFIDIFKGEAYRGTGITFYEDFESYSVGDWSTTDYWEVWGNTDITTDTKNSGTKSVKITQPSAGIRFNISGFRTNSNELDIKDGNISVYRYWSSSGNCNNCDVHSRVWFNNSNSKYLEIFLLYNGFKFEYNNPYLRPSIGGISNNVWSEQSWNVSSNIINPLNNGNDMGLTKRYANSIRYWEGLTGADASTYYEYIDDFSVWLFKPNSSNNIIQSKKISLDTFSAIKVSYNSNGTIKINLSNDNGTTWLENTQNSSITSFGSESSHLTYKIIFEDDARIYDLNLSISEPDFLPPSIVFYNMTSSGGCISWNSDKKTACVTADTTPSVFLKTDENARCRIGTEDLNYTSMGSSRACSGGEETKEHTCTLKSEDELFYRYPSIYISCMDLFENENSTSTSGELSLEITGLEESARASIETAIQNSIVSGYTVYTGQKIYLRHNNGNQGMGTFDKFVKKGDKNWAFNYITDSEKNEGLFNLTPSLYILEMANITSSQITNLVEGIITSTK